MTRPTLIATLLVAAVCLPLASRVSHAQPTQHKTPAPKDLEAARKHFQSAEAAKARGEYQTAAVEYLAAYELFEEPAFFYDTAEVYRLAGDEKSALVYYTKYLELAPSGQGAATARVAADQLRRSIAAKEDAARRAADQEARRKADEAKRKPDEDGHGKADQPTTTAAATEPSPDDRTAEPPEPPAPRATVRGRRLRIAGLASGGAGVVAIGIGVVFGLKARSLSNEASSWDTFDRDRDAQGKADERNLFVFTGIGAAALVTGGVLYYLGHRAERTSPPDAVSFAPSVGPSQITFTATGRF
ncbi:MAG TPA: hypothetical protein VFK02_04045 [Kofleriaceae bacterium]|nr:hypothetical protein [Kofleriaceae bacterium]